MVEIIQRTWNKYQERLAYAVSSLGVLVYGVKSWVFIHTLTSIVYDESGYIARGFMLSTGKYSPYADYGPFLDHMPLSFLIPGYVQKFFNPGIGTARYFTFTIGFLSLLGLWLTSRAIGGKWLAALPIWVMALNPAWIETYSLGYSQILILFFTTWAIFFAVGEKRETWQIILAALFAALAGMTRIYMMPVIFFVVLYIFWQHGRKAGLIALASGLIPIFLIHFVFWPEILKMWALYIPKGLLSFIEPFQVPYTETWKMKYIQESFSFTGWSANPDHVIWIISNAFWRGIQLNLFPVLGVFITILLWPKTKNWRSSFHFRTGVFLLVLYLSLFLIHGWAALSASSCRYSCFKGYLTFFNNIGLLLIILAILSWRKKLPTWRYLLLGVFLSLFIFGLINGTYMWRNSISDLIPAIANAEVPRMKNLRFLPGTIPLWSFVENKFGIIPKFFKHNLNVFFFWYFPIIIGMIFFPLISWILKKRVFKKLEFYQVITFITLFTVMLLSPNKYFGGTINTIQCDSNIIKSHQEVGTYLNSIIPKSSKVYWGLESWMLFLYMPNIEIYPSQTMIHYTYINYDIETDAEILLKFGYWDEELKEQWINEADYILVEGRFFESQWKSRVESGELIILDTTAAVESCRSKDVQIFVITKKTDIANGK